VCACTRRRLRHVPQRPGPGKRTIRSRPSTREPKSRQTYTPYTRTNASARAPTHPPVAPFARRPRCSAAAAAAAVGRAGGRAGRSLSRVLVPRPCVSVSPSPWTRKTIIARRDRRSRRFREQIDWLCRVRDGPAVLVGAFDRNNATDNTSWRCERWRASDVRAARRNRVEFSLALRHQSRRTKTFAAEAERNEPTGFPWRI